VGWTRDPAVKRKRRTNSETGKKVDVRAMFIIVLRCIHKKMFIKGDIEYS
jgi:hypothetical protein